MKLTHWIGYGAVLVAVAIGAAGGFLTGYLQALAGNLSATVFGLALVIIFVNSLLNSSEKRQAARPLLRMIHPQVAKLHNDFVAGGQQRFGIAQFKQLIDIYQQNKRNPQAFSPEQRDALYDLIVEKRNDITATFDILQDQLRELTTIAGWSFDPTLVSAALSARLNMATFKALAWDARDATKRSAIESYLDAEADVTSVFRKLTTYLGLKDEEWQSNSP